MNYMRSDRTWQAMALRLFRPLLVILIVIALIGAPLAVQAAAPMPCHGAYVSMADPADPGHLAAPCDFPAPCKSMAPACVGALSCFSIVTLSGPQNAATEELSWVPVAYWGDNYEIDGLSVDPLLGPPIAI